MKAPFSTCSSVAAVSARGSCRAYLHCIQSCPPLTPPAASRYTPCLYGCGYKHRFSLQLQGGCCKERGTPTAPAQLSYFLLQHMFAKQHALDVFRESCFQGMRSSVGWGGTQTRDGLSACDAVLLLSAPQTGTCGATTVTQLRLHDAGYCVRGSSAGNVRVRTAAGPVSAIEARQSIRLLPVNVVLLLLLVSWRFV